ncbi:E3 ubiquitin-protein ligase RNF217-like [Cynocephalus volans]|uniref:E3 ubiquitin-protein ligase RNF217-like n=1 Tax=Cynocephalus volans TaxID=110931 RepID=UPI002FC94542
MQPGEIRALKSESKGGCERERPPKFVRGRDEITGDEYDGQDRVEMSCGHTVDPESLKAWCLQLINQRHSKLCCPADVKGEKCGAQWSYPEVRRSAMLGASEQRDFEQKLALFALRLYCDFKECPGCKSFVERKDQTSLRVLCTICTSTQGKDYEFCWQCLKAWKGPGTSSVRCGNEGCRDQILHVLATCATKDLPGSEVRDCPSIRACPTCGLLIEHKKMCKYVTCSQCHVAFCFACLETAQACQDTRPNSWFRKCAKSLAPRQSHVPVWSQPQQRSPRESHVDHGNNQQQQNRPPVDSDGRCVIL